MNSPSEKSLSFKVKQSTQGSSGGSSYVRFDVHVVVTESPNTRITFDSVYPNNPDPTDLTAARDAIESGFREALKQYPYGVAITVDQLTLHPVDFNPAKFKYWAKYHLESQLATLREASD